jgi:hypothetical protein
MISTCYDPFIWMFTWGKWSTTVLSLGAGDYVPIFYALLRRDLPWVLVGGLLNTFKRTIMLFASASLCPPIWLILSREISYRWAHVLSGRRELENLCLSVIHGTSQISKFDFKFYRTEEGCILLWTMYGPTFFKPLKFFMKRLWTKNIQLPIWIFFWPNLDIIVIIMLYFWDYSWNVPYNSNWIIQ